MRHVAVIDIGKTNAKLALVRLTDLSEVAVVSRPNAVVPGPPYPHFDTVGLWQFIVDGLRDVNRIERVDAVAVTAHGATAALLDTQGAIALPVLDYEHDGPTAVGAAYDALRPDFAETGSPRLPNGLNLGAQLHWQAQAFPETFDRVAHVLTWPQYWSFRLSGVRACDVCSLGTHTDLWNPLGRRPSSLIARLGLSGRLSPVLPPHAVLGPILPGLARELGLDPAVAVFCGIHDSNASLLPHLLDRPAPFAVVSTGTWVVCMAVGGRKAALDPACHTLINVNAFGDPVPSTNFMGGREFSDSVPDGATGSEDALSQVLARRHFLLPGLTPGSGPFPAARSPWRAAPADLDPAARFTVSSLYLALMTQTCLDMIAATGPVLVEGPFARSALFLRALSALTGRRVQPQPASRTGTSAGAALLAVMQDRAARRAARLSPEPDPTPDPFAESIRSYGRAWRAEIALG